VAHDDDVSNAQELDTVGQNAGRVVVDRLELVPDVPLSKDRAWWSREDCALRNQGIAEERTDDQPQKMTDLQQKSATNQHPRNRYSGCCPFFVRSYNRLGLEEFSTAERKSWFLSARYTRSGNLVAVSSK
jgi:hypothetical protein